MNYQSEFLHQHSTKFDESINGFQDSLQLYQCFEKYQDESNNSPSPQISKFNGLMPEQDNNNNLGTHNQEKTYYCKVENCFRPFKAECLLKDHMRMHQQSLPYRKTLITENIITEQQISKPFQCSQCPQSFSQNSNLKRHLRIHTNEKPFTCDLCKKAFNTSSNLKQHSQVHLNEETRKQYVCDIQGCHKFYFYASNLKKHKEAHEMRKCKLQAKQPQPSNQSCQIQSQEIIQSNYSGIYNYNNPIIVLNNGELFLLINSLLYNISKEEIFGHELQPSRQHPYQEYECNPLQEIAHWQSFDEIKQLYTRIESEQKQQGNNLSYSMLINLNNCNSLWCSCHTMTEHNNWKNCINNPLKFDKSQFIQNESSSQSESEDSSQVQINGLCLCKETVQYKHKHSNHCGHPAIRHADHLDYLVGNQLHFLHGKHCDSHGYISLCDVTKLSPKEIEAVQTLEKKIINNTE